MSVLSLVRVCRLAYGAWMLHRMLHYLAAEGLLGVWRMDWREETSSSDSGTRPRSINELCDGLTSYGWMD